jgi:hypothetical protein
MPACWGSTGSRPFIMPLAALFSLPFAARPSLCPGPMKQGGSYVRISGLQAHISYLMPIGIRLPCRRSYAAWTGALSFADELRVDGVLGSSF